MAVDTEPVLFFAVPHAGSLAMKSYLPITEDCSMALGTEVIRLLETYHFAVCEPQGVPVIRIVTVKTPSTGHML